MTTREAIYKTALEYIQLGADAVCVDCGWIGTLEQASNCPHMVHPLYGCPQCTENDIRGGADEIARYSLEQAEKVQP